MSLAIIRGFTRKSSIIEQSFFVGKFYSSQASDTKYRSTSSASPSPSPSSPSTPNTSSTTRSSVAKLATETYNSRNVRKNIRGYVFSRYIDYVRNYDKVLESKFPKTMHVTRVFMIGVKDFYNDMKKFLKIVRIINGSTQGLRALTRKELELYYQMPKDMGKAAPVLLISALPFANYVIFPMAYMYPRLMLTSHFWSTEQRSEFQQIVLKKRLEYNRKVLQCMESKLGNLSNDNENITKWKYILGLLNNGGHPTCREILDVMDIFKKPPYHFDSLPYYHLKYLCGLHGIHKGFRKRYRLSEYTKVVHHMDLAIRREGGVHNMPPESLKHSCFLRGLNAINLTDAQMIDWLEDWVEVSLQVDKTNISLFLHLPILISYNHPNNVILLHKD